MQTAPNLCSGIEVTATKHSIRHALAFVVSALIFGMVSPLKLIANSPLVALTTGKRAKVRGTEQFGGMTSA